MKNSTHKLRQARTREDAQARREHARLQAAVVSAAVVACTPVAGRRPLSYALCLQPLCAAVDALNAFEFVPGHPRLTAR